MASLSIYFFHEEETEYFEFMLNSGVSRGGALGAEAPRTRGPEKKEEETNERERRKEKGKEKERKKESQ